MSHFDMPRPPLFSFRSRRRLQAQPPVTLWTLCWWTAVGVFAGAVLSAAVLAWMGASR